MLLGHVQRTLDDKGRFVLPELFRDALHGPLYFALGEDGEIAIWPQEAFQTKLAEKKELERTGGADGVRAFRRFTTYASPAKVDAQFRIPIPEVLREKAGIDRTRPLVVTGVHDRVEIWDAQRYEDYLG